MMYSNKMAFAIKTKGRVLREFGDTVRLPFGSEYSIFIKNLNSVRAKVRITIDSVDITDGTSLIINGNSELELSRFIKNGNLHSGNALKFIERTGSVERHRGVGVEDGLIRIEYEFERVYPAYRGPYWYVPPNGPYYNVDPDTYYTSTTTTSWSGATNEVYRGEVKSAAGLRNTKLKTKSADRNLGSDLKAALDKGGDFRGLNSSDPNYSAQLRSHVDYVNAVGGSINCSAQGLGIASSGANTLRGHAQVQNMSFQEEKCRTPSASFAAQVNEVGVTVPGSVSNQQFHTVSDFTCDGETHVMVLKLLGETEAGHAITQPVMVKAKPRCITCGRVNRSNNKFCAECGTSLELV